MLFDRHFLTHWKLPVICMFLLLMFSACASVPGTTTESVQVADPAEEAVFQQGEDLLRKGADDQALSSYSLYLQRNPQGRHAAEALHRLGTIYQRKGVLDAAQAFYRSAFEQFPDSPAAVEAQLALIDLLGDERRAAEAAEIAARMLEGPLDNKVKQSLYRRLTRLYQDSDDPTHSVWYAYLLYKQLPQGDREQWELQLKETIARLDADGIEMLWDRIDDRKIRGHLMYRYGVVQVQKENYDDALEVLTGFQNAYPNHPYEADALDLIKTLTQKLAFTPSTLGCLLPLSGSYQAYGQRVLNAVELALSQMQVGEKPLPIKLVVEDTGSDDARAVQGVQKLAQAGVGAIMGPILTAPAAAREAQKLNIPILTLTQKSEITNIGDFVFRHFLTPQSQVRTLVSYFINDLGVRKFAVMYPDEPYGKTFMNLFWDEVIRQGGRMIGLESYSPGQTDFAETIKRLVGNHYHVPANLQGRAVVQVKEGPYFQQRAEFSDRLEKWLPDPITRLTGLFYQNPDQDRIKGPAGGRIEAEGARPNVEFDVLFIPDAPKMAGLILPQLAYYDIRDIYTIGTNLWHSRQLIDMAQQYAQNAVLVDGFFQDSASAVVRNFVDTYQSIYNVTPGLMEAFAFDTANLLFSLLARPDIRLRHQLRNHLKQMSQIEGVTGATAFESNGEPIKKLTLLRIKGDQFIEIKP